MAPRKAKAHQPNQHLSDLDVDSDTPVIPQDVPSVERLPVRTNDQLNLAVLKRHNSQISAILSIAPYVVIYVFSNTSQAWEKSGIEGTLFVCQLVPTAESGAERYQVVVLNRRGLENFQLELKKEDDVEVTDEYVILVDSATAYENASNTVPEVYGLWIYAEQPPSSTAQMQILNARLIKDCAQRAEASRNDVATVLTPFASPHISSVSAKAHPPMQAENGLALSNTSGYSRQLSLLELFQQPTNPQDGASQQAFPNLPGSPNIYGPLTVPGPSHGQPHTFELAPSSNVRPQQPKNGIMASNVLDNLILGTRQGYPQYS